MTVYADRINAYILFHKETVLELLWQRSKNSSILLSFNDEIKRFYLFGVRKVVIKLRTGKSVDKLFLSHETNASRDPLEILNVNLVHDFKQLHTWALSEEQVGHRIKKLAVCTAY